MRLYLIRHGESTNNALPEHQRVEDPHLTSLGQVQAEALGRWATQTRIDVLLVSPFRRTLQTAAPIQRVTRLSPRIWVDLHERGGCYAGWQPSNFRGRPGFSHEEILQVYPNALIEDPIDAQGWWRSQPRETDEQAAARAERILARLKQTFLGTEQHIACVMHADFKKLLVDAALGRLDAGFLYSPYRNGSVTTLDIAADGSITLTKDNCTAHIDRAVSNH